MLPTHRNALLVTTWICCRCTPDQSVAGHQQRWRGRSPAPRNALPAAQSLINTNSFLTLTRVRTSVGKCNGKRSDEQSQMDPGSDSERPNAPFQDGNRASFSAWCELVSDLGNLRDRGSDNGFQYWFTSCA